MIEVKEDRVIIDGNEKLFKQINLIKTEKDGLCFSNRLVDCLQCKYSTRTLYNEIVKSGEKGFIIINNVIVNLNNVESMHIRYYQYAGISIHKCLKQHADLCFLTLECKNGRYETLPFSTHKEAEKCYHEIDAALAELRNNEVIDNLMKN